MNQGRIIVITGSPGTGKTTTASIVAKESNMDKSVHMHTDDFFHYLGLTEIYENAVENDTETTEWLQNRCREILRESKQALN